MSDDVPTGIAGLDQLLGGGLVRGNTYLVRGAPGTGKTTLGIQYLHHGATAHGERGVFLSFEERADQLEREARSLGLELRELIESERLVIVPSSPEAALEMISDATSRLSRLLSEPDVRRIAVDSLSLLRSVAGDEFEQRSVVHRLVKGLVREQLTPLLIAELPAEGSSVVQFEEYLADGVLHLGHELVGSRRRRRFVEVTKTRGRPFVSGRHSVEIGAGGLTVYPSCSRADDRPIEPSGKRIPSGIEGLDDLLHGGFYEGSANLVAGSSGTGKTLFGLQFLAQGAALGEPSLLISFKERPEAIRFEAGAVGISGDLFGPAARIATLFRSPVDLNVDQLFAELCDTIARLRPRRVVIDALTDLENAIPDADYLRDYLFSLVEMLARGRVTSIFTHEVTEMFGSFTITHQRLSGILHSLVFLRYVEDEGQIKMALSLLKLRGSDHARTIHELRASLSGLAVGAAFEGREGVMAGSAFRVGEAARDVKERMDRREEALRRLKDRGTMTREPTPRNREVTP